MGKEGLEKPRPNEVTVWANDQETLKGHESGKADAIDYHLNNDFGNVDVISNVRADVKDTAPKVRPKGNVPEGLQNRSIKAHLEGSELEGVTTSLGAATGNDTAPADRIYASVAKAQAEAAAKNKALDALAAKEAADAIKKAQGTPQKTLQPKPAPQTQKGGFLSTVRSFFK